MHKIILKVRYFKRELSKRLTKGDFIFSAGPSPWRAGEFGNGIFSEG